MAHTPLTPENFELLLLCFNSDREKAGEEYELLWQKMREYFAARGAICAEDLADEALSRLAKKYAEGEEIRDFNRYSYGLARLIWMESLRRPENNYVSFDQALGLSFVLPDFLLTEEENARYVHCIRQITDEERNLMIEYWDHEEESHYEARRQQAIRMGISPTALRIRVSRIRKKLEACLANCLEKKTPKAK
ncbi:MAG: sigma-70 family RNA polymerase sigma factor [Acidobacteria bacterium]|nr:sigma-70 family RNA polymerase sigma factor [Acidobacteriota bacterium]